MLRKPMSIGLFAAVVSAGLALAPVAFAQDKMSHDDGMKKEHMSKGGMKHDTMSKGTMSKDGMKKHDKMDKMSK